MAGITLPAIAAAVAEEIPKIFDDAFNRARDGGASTIKDGNPTSIPGKVGQAVARSACRRYGANPGSFPANRQVRIEAACRPYLDDLNPGDGAGIGIPFEGGQCDEFYRMNGAVEYEVFIGNTGGTSEPSEVVVTEFILSGPIGGISFTYDTPGPFGPRRWIMTVGTAAGPVAVRAVLNPISTNTVRNAKFVGSFQLQGGALDNCGDPPPVIRQPRPRPDGNPPPFRYNPDGDININVGVDVLPDGTINVNVGGPTFNVDPFSGGGGSDAPTGPPPGDIGDAGGSSSTGAGGDAEGEAGAGDVLVGIKVDVLASPPNARQYAPGIFRGAGYIYMGVINNLDQDYGGSMLKSGQFFFAEKENLTHWQVSANNGYNFNVTPYYREAPE